jgi:thiosulfate dehydrogenase
MFKGLVVGILLSIAAAAAIGYAVVSSGAIPVATWSGPILGERWAAKTDLRAILARAAPKGPNPVRLTDANLVAGIDLYARHCSICHGTAQGKKSASPIAKGEYPAPPQLASEGVEDDPEGWTYWKIENGIRWTGMPAWRGTLSPQQIWMLALFLKHMNKLPLVAVAAWQQVGNRPVH